MSSRVIRRKTVVISVGLLVSGEFTYNIDVPFHAHDMVVRAWSHVGTMGGGNGAVLKLNWVGIGDIFHFEGDQSQTPRNVFNVNRSFSGTQHFQCLDVDGALHDTSSSQLGFTLEFLEYGN